MYAAWELHHDELPGELSGWLPQGDARTVSYCRCVQQRAGAFEIHIQENTMTTAAKRNRESLPVGDLGIIALQSSRELGSKVNDYIVEWRSERDHRHKALPQLEGYARDNYLIRTDDD